MLTISLLFILWPSLASIVVKKTHASEFEQRYTLHDPLHQRTNLLIVGCKEYQVLNLMVLPLGGSE